MPDMPKFEKSPAELAERFAAVMDRVAFQGPGVTRKKMFGYPSAFVNGHMATGLHGSSWFVRLAASSLAELLASGLGRPFEPMPGRPMKGYVVLAPETVSDDEAIDAWVAAALAFTASLPPKV